MHALFLLCLSIRRAAAPCLMCVASVLLLTAAMCSPALCPSACAQSNADESLREPRANIPLTFCNNWLIALDSGNAPGTHNLASESFKKNVPYDKWNTIVATLRKTFGRTAQRSARKCEFLSKPAGMPPGEYFAVLYTTSFDKAKFRNERVIAIKDGDAWRVFDWAILNK